MKVCTLTDGFELESDGAGRPGLRHGPSGRRFVWVARPEWAVLIEQWQARPENDVLRARGDPRWLAACEAVGQCKRRRLKARWLRWAIECRPGALIGQLWVDKKARVSPHTGQPLVPSALFFTRREARAALPHVKAPNGYPMWPKARVVRVRVTIRRVP